MTLAAAYAHCEAEARAHARDRWLGSLFAPPDRRGHLHALIAFELEMGRLRENVRDPRMGEIRLVWWREALSGAREEEAQANPVAAAMRDTLAQAQASPHLIENAVSARQFDLYDDALAGVGDLEAYLGETRSGLLQIGALALAGGRDPGAAEASGLAGVALGIADLLASLHDPRPPCWIPHEELQRHGATPEDFRARRMTPGVAAALRDLIGIARKRQAEAEAALALLPATLAPAYAGLATVPLWLDAVSRDLDHAFERPPRVAAWRRQWALWRWARRR